MRSLIIIGTLLVLLGIVGLAVGVIPIHHREEIAKIGPLTASTDKEKDIRVPPYAAGGIIVLGGLLVYAGATGRRRPG